MHFSCMVLTTFVFFAAMRESTCDSSPTIQTEDGSVYMECTSGQYYKMESECNVLQETPTSIDDYRILIGKDGPAVEGTYCCNSTCTNSYCGEYSPSKFIEAPEANISLNASSSRSFSLDIMSYISIGKISMEELLQVVFEVVASNGTKIAEYVCLIRENTSCFGDDYSINRSTYELIIFRIDPNIPTFHIRTLFNKYTQSENGMVRDSGPTFYITVHPVVTLFVDKASDNFTCSVETSLPATLKVLVDSNVSVALNITSTSFNYTNSSSHLPGGKHQLACEVTTKSLDGVLLTSRQSEPIIVPTPTTESTTDPPSSSALSPHPTTTSPPNVETLIIVTATSVTGGVVIVVILVLITAVIIMSRNKTCRSVPVSNV